MTDMKLPKHSHCKFCRDYVPFREVYCDDECRRSEVDSVIAERHGTSFFMDPSESSSSP